MRLHRDTPPERVAQRWVIGFAGDEPVVMRGEPRALEVRAGDPPDADDLHDAFEKACAVLWGGQEWRAGIESVCGLRAGTTRRWRQQGVLPPARIVAWIAYLSRLPNARAVGYALRAAALDPSSQPGEVAAAALDGMRG